MLAERIPWCVAEVGEREELYVVEALRSGQFGPGATGVTAFELALARRVGVRHAVATNSGSSALHVALLLADVGPDDEVIVPAWTFVATANAVRHVGAWPVALDVDERHWQLDPAQLTGFLREHTRSERGRTINTATGRRVAAVVPVHLLGHPADLPAIQAVAAEYGLAVVEDAAQAIGADGIATSGLAVISFNFNKLITAGAGGALLLNDGEHAAHARYLINQARTSNGSYQHGDVGFNYQMTGLHAAVGLAQLESLDVVLGAKRRIRDRYRRQLSDLPGVCWQQDAPGVRSTGWLSTILLDPDTSGLDVPGLRRHLADAGIDTGAPWTPLHFTGAHPGCAPRPCPVAERLGAQSLHLPSSSMLTADDQLRVIDAVRAATAPEATGRHLLV